MEPAQYGAAAAEEDAASDTGDWYPSTDESVSSPDFEATRTKKVQGKSNQADLTQDSSFCARPAAGDAAAVSDARTSASEEWYEP